MDDENNDVSTTTISVSDKKKRARKEGQVRHHMWHLVETFATVNMN